MNTTESSTVANHSTAPAANGAPTYSKWKDRLTILQKLAGMWSFR